jgi:hypothetical protein
MISARIGPTVPNLFCQARYGQGGSGAPVMDPDLSWREVRTAAARILPGVRYRRHLLRRYSLLWHKSPG